MNPAARKPKKKPITIAALKAQAAFAKAAYSVRDDHLALEDYVGKLVDQAPEKQSGKR